MITVQYLYWGDNLVMIHQSGSHWGSEGTVRVGQLRNPSEIPAPFSQYQGQRVPRPEGREYRYPLTLADRGPSADSLRVRGPRDVFSDYVSSAGKARLVREREQWQRCSRDARSAVCGRGSDFRNWFGGFWEPESMTLQWTEGQTEYRPTAPFPRFTQLMPSQPPV